MGIKIWTLIKNENVNRYFNTYLELAPSYEEICLYQNSEFSFLPRYMYQSHPARYLIRHIDKSWVGKQVKVEWNKNKHLRPEQKTICQNIFTLIQSNRDKVGIIKGRPGIGKTVISVALTCAVKKKTLIVLDNSNLIKQWTDTICTFTNVKEDEIGLIKGPKFTTNEDTPFTICMVQTLISKVKRDMKNFYIKMKDCGFDLVFFDECHKTTCGPKFATASLFLNTKNIVGLSATPFADNLHKVFMNNTIGDIVVEDSNYELIPTINMTFFDSGLTAKYLRYVNYGGDKIKKRSRYISKLKESIAYKQLMKDLVKSLIDEDHCIIIIVFTKVLVELIHKWLKEIGIDSRIFYSGKEEIDKENDKIIIATYAYAGAGFDMKRLSAAIIGTPLSGRKSLIQVIGRIVRSLKGKQNPVVYDIVDTGFNGLFVEDVPYKLNVLKSEFKCKINKVEM